MSINGGEEKKDVDEGDKEKCMKKICVDERDECMNLGERDKCEKIYECE